MTATIIGLAGALIAVVIGVAIAPAVLDEIDTLENVIGDDGFCVVVSHRYGYSITSASANSATFSSSVYKTALDERDAPLGERWEYGAELASSRHTGVPQNETCEPGLDTRVTQVAEATVWDGTNGNNPRTNQEPARIVGTFAPQNPSSDTPLVISDSTPVSMNSNYVGIVYERGTERQYSGVMIALVTLMPLLIIVGIVVFIVFKFGLGNMGGIITGGRRRF